MSHSYGSYIFGNQSVTVVVQSMIGDAMLVCQALQTSKNGPEIALVDISLLGGVWSLLADHLPARIALVGMFSHHNLDHHTRVDASHEGPGQLKAATAHREFILGAYHSDQYHHHWCVRISFSESQTLIG